MQANISFACVSNGNEGFEICELQFTNTKFSLNYIPQWRMVKIEQFACI